MRAPNQLSKASKKCSLAVKYKMHMYLHHKSMAANCRKTDPALLKQNVISHPTRMHC